MGNVDMKDYVLKNKPEPASNETVWAFDLGHPLRPDRGEDRGEVSNSCNQKAAVNPYLHPQFLHNASLPWRGVVRWLNHFVLGHISNQEKL
jgi:hypothetical protein